ncbi:hypothetical protein FOCC_FOCC001460 [Frankliniella occidentalis]|nr:hypothetical protein FOCC_FOCC001460 [Frankliniella occidentalis]
MVRPKELLDSKSDDTLLTNTLNVKLVRSRAGRRPPRLDNTMRGSTLFNTVAHCTTVYYYAHVLRYIADMRATVGDEKVLHNFIDFRPKFFTMWGLTVTAMFWALFTLDRELVMPAALDKAIPVWLNHAMHSFVLVLVVVQVLAEPHHPPPLGLTLTLALAVSGGYIYTLLNEYAVTGRWIYPVFDVLGWPGRAALMAATIVLFLSQVLLAWAAVRARWGHAKSTSRGGKKRKD